MWSKLYNVTLALENFKCSCNLCETRVNNNLEITSVHSSSDLVNKFELEDHLLT